MYYEPKNKNLTAVNTIRSWCKAVGIPVYNSKIPGCDLTIECRLGGEMEVIVATNEDITLTCMDAVRIMANQILCTRKSKAPVGQTPLQVALEAFHTITRPAGYGEPVPVNRGKEPDRKLSYKNDEFLVALRANEFRRSPNPEKDRFEKYRFILESVSLSIFYMTENRKLFARHGYDLEDLHQYARSWLVNFCGRNEIPNPKYNDNQKQLTVYLRQRFWELCDILKRKERSTIPDIDTVFVGLYGRAFSKVDTQNRFFEEEFLTEAGLMEKNKDHEYISRHKELKTGDKNSRRSSAAQLLSKELSKMDHDKMVELLEEASINIAFDPDAQREAKRRLKTHQKTCEKCQLILEVDEDSTSTDDGCMDE